jgi:hypothetical protein
MAVLNGSALDALPSTNIRETQIHREDVALPTAAEQLPKSATSLVSLVGAKAPLLAPAAIIAATISSCILYADPNTLVGYRENALAVTVGLCVSLCVLVLAVAHATARDGNGREYQELWKRLNEVEAQLTVYGDPAYAEHRSPVALEQVRADVARLRSILLLNGAEWASGNGYIAAWKLLHHAEEALLEVRPREGALAGGINDALRLSGSAVEHADQLTYKLNEAIKVLSPETFQRYLQSPPSSGALPPAAANGKLAASAMDNVPADKNADPSAETESCAECMAKGILREVRYAIDEYRDNFRAGLLRTRNILLATLTFTALATHALASAAVMHNVDRAVIVAASTYFALGAIVGLFNRLRIASRASNTENAFDIEDYGLAWARCMAAPIFSGLAAVIGVFIASQLHISVSGMEVPLGAKPSDLTQIFSLHDNLAGLFVAAIFGTAPELLTSYLQKPAAELKKGLRSSASSGAQARS